MSYRESDIMHENGDFFVIREPKCYNVCRSGFVHAMSIVQFSKDEDGLSLAIAYVNYKASHA